LNKPVTGEIYLANLEPIQGSEQGGRRTVIVFQNPNLARFTSTVLCVPTTTNLARLGLPGTCFIKQGEGGLNQDSVALAFQARALDASRLSRRFGKLSQEILEDLADAVLDAFGVTVEEK